ncbi:MAG: hypothetical protein ACQCN6_09435 [Candidatus Bathyarchaeia archaeon]|jgi:uncharacterized membrane protein YjjP (DUF1212 family)
MATNKEKREYTKTEVYLGNLVVITWILLGAAVCALFNIFAGLAFAAVLGFLIYYEIGKKGCVSCFYCKTCTIGMGKIFDVFFTKRGKENVNRKALKLFPFVYVLISFVPIVLVLFAIIQQVTVLKLGLLVGLLIFSFVSGIGVARRTLQPAKHGK